MKRSLGILLSMLVAGVVGFSQVGCTIRYVSYQEPAPPLYPNAYRIQGRAQNQIGRIEGAVRLRNLDSRAGEALADNDDSVLELVRYFQESSYPIRDITSREALFLDGMLDDNMILVNDAIRRRQAWNNYFSGSYAYNFSSNSDCRIYAVYSTYQLKCQQNDIVTAYNAGRLSQAQADEMRERVRVVRNQRLEACRTTGHWEMSGTQASQTRQMTEDNSRLFKYRSAGGAGAWTKDKFKQWNKVESIQKNSYIKDTHWNPSQIRAAKPGEPSGKGFQAQEQAAPAPTPMPVAAPAQPTAPVEQIQEERPRPGDLRDRDKRKNGRRFQPEGTRRSQDSQEPPALPDSTTTSPANNVNHFEGTEKAKDPGRLEPGQSQEAVDAQPNNKPRDLMRERRERVEKMSNQRKLERSHRSKEAEKEGDSSKDSKPSADSTPGSSDGDKDAKDDSDKQHKGRPGFGHHKSDEDK